jgi:hypothetical protein
MSVIATMGLIELASPRITLLAADLASAKTIAAVLTTYVPRCANELGILPASLTGFLSTACAAADDSLPPQCVVVDSLMELPSFIASVCVHGVPPSIRITERMAALWQINNAISLMFEQRASSASVWACAAQTAGPAALAAALHMRAMDYLRHDVAVNTAEFEHRVIEVVASWFIAVDGAIWLADVLTVWFALIVSSLCDAVAESVRIISLSRRSWGLDGLAAHLLALAAWFFEEIPCVHAVFKDELSGPPTVRIRCLIFMYVSPNPLDSRLYGAGRLFWVYCGAGPILTSSDWRSLLASNSSLNFSMRQ